MTVTRSPTVTLDERVGGHVGRRLGGDDRMRSHEAEAPGTFVTPKVHRTVCSFPLGDDLLAR